MASGYEENREIRVFQEIEDVYNRNREVSIGFGNMRIIGYLKKKIREFKSIASDFPKNDKVSPSFPERVSEALKVMRKEGKVQRAYGESKFVRKM